MMSRTCHPELPASRKAGLQGLTDREMPKQVTNDRIVQNTNNEQIFTSLSVTDFTRDPSLRYQ